MRRLVLFPLSDKQKKLLFWFELFSAVFGVIGALAIALNLEISKYGYFLFLISSLSSLGIGHLTKLRSVVILGYMYTFTNLIGIYRWFS